MRYAFVLLIVATLSGCAGQSTLYKWGSYEQALYEGYKDTTKMEALRLKLEGHIGEMEKLNQKVAPGLYAELGTLYLQGGAADKAINMYSRERDIWPESKGLMTAMIQNLQRRTQKQAEGTK